MGNNWNKNNNGDRHQATDLGNSEQAKQHRHRKQANEWKLQLGISCWHHRKSKWTLNLEKI